MSSRHHNPMQGAFDDYESDGGDHAGDSPDGADFLVCDVIEERDHAILIMLTETQDTHWVPKSVIHEDSEVFDMEHSEGTMIVHRWWAEKEGLL